MYSVVLMAALTTTTADATSFGWRGCHGGWRGCHGGNGCYGYGGCHGYNGCCGCNGAVGYAGGHGCYGGWYGGCYGGGFYTGCIGGCHSNYAPVPVSPPGKTPEKIMKPAEEIKKEGATPKEAKLIVDLPADAKLFIDDRPMQFTSQHPIFVTPGLQDGKTYYYDLRAEIMRDGKAVSDTKRVVFHSGDELRESFASLERKTSDKVAAGIK
jgi:uncharacterized protein (TIGR03000 family)